MASGRCDAVVCQFGSMFLPEKVAGFAETRRVLRPGGTFLFNVWDRIEDNEFADCVTQALASLFPNDPPSIHGTAAPRLPRPNCPHRCFL